MDKKPSRAMIVYLADRGTSVFFDKMCLGSTNRANNRGAYYPNISISSRLRIAGLLSRYQADSVGFEKRNGIVENTYIFNEGRRLESDLDQWKRGASVVAKIAAGLPGGV